MSSFAALLPQEMQQDQDMDGSDDDDDDEDSDGETSDQIVHVATADL